MWLEELQVASTSTQKGRGKEKKRRDVPLQPSSPHDAIFQQQYQSCYDCKTVPSCLAVL